MSRHNACEDTETDKRFESEIRDSIVTVPSIGTPQVNGERDGDLFRLRPCLTYEPKRPFGFGSQPLRVKPKADDAISISLW